MASLPKLVEEPKEDEKEMEEETVVWVNHYSSTHDILLVGEGDFSFSLSLANSFGSGSNIVATSLDSREDLASKYSKAKANLESLEKMGATILHGVDAMKMKRHTDLKMRKFDRIVFNFPHAGFKGKEDHVHMINLHKQLVRGFFENSRDMLWPSGEVHVSHKTHGPYREWKLEELAAKNSLVLFECADFRIGDYPGYSNKRGDAARCDQPFPLGKCCTFKFRVGDINKMKKAARSNMGSVCGRSLTDTVEIRDGSSRNISRTEHPLALPQADYRFNIWRRPQTDGTVNVEGVPGRAYHPYGNHLEGAYPLFGRSCPAFSSATQGVLGNVYLNGVNGASCGTAFGYTRCPPESEGWSRFRGFTRPILPALAQELEATRKRDLELGCNSVRFASVEENFQTKSN